MSWQLASFAVLAAVLLGGFAWYERSRPPSQIVALVAALAALAVAGRLVLAAIPNVVATTDVVIFSGYALGAAPGFAVGALAGLISNFWLGQGPWTPWQMAGWGLAGMLGALLAYATRRRAGRLELTLACGLAGIAFGALLNFSLMVSYGGDFTLDRWLVLEGRAVPFDLAHAIGNVTLALLAGPAMVRMLIRFRERFEFRWSAGGGRPSGGIAGAATALLVLVLVAPMAPTPAIAKGGAVGWLQSARNGDGGFPATPGGESNPQMTGWAMLGLEGAGVNPLDLHRPTAVDYLRGHAGDLRAPTDLSLAILALRGAGLDPHHFTGLDLVARLSGRQRRNGSFEGWPNPTAFAVMALRSSGAHSGIRAALGWLRRVQGHDGGWGAVPGSASDPDSTGAVLEALGGGSPASRRAVGFLRHSQLRSGGWPLAAPGPANSQSTAWAIQGLLAAGVSPDEVREGGRSGLDYLAARRARDGHYRYSSSSDQTPVWVTAQAVVAAHSKPFPLAPVARSSPSGRDDTGGGAVDRAGGGGAAGGATGVGEGGAAPSERFAPERAGRNAGSHNGSSRQRRVRKGSATGTTPGESSGKQHPVSNTAFTGHAGDGDDGRRGGSSPLAAVLIALGAAALVAGGTWIATRRFTW